VNTKVTRAALPHHTTWRAQSVEDSTTAVDQSLIGSQVAKQYTRLLRLWPADALRPNLPFTRAIEARALPYGVKPLNNPEESARTPGKTTPVPSPADVKATTASTHPNPTPQEENAQITALFSLLENRYAKKYPLSEAVFKPTSAPDHYTKLMEEIERAPQKTWWQAKVDEWKMKIRWQ
jgi:cytochrome b pre-mRNA-processing protein 6